jgi:hypothetical protein
MVAGANITIVISCIVGIGIHIIVRFRLIPVNAKAVVWVCGVCIVGDENRKAPPVMGAVRQ